MGSQKVVQVPIKAAIVFLLLTSISTFCNENSNLNNSLIKRDTVYEFSNDSIQNEILKRRYEDKKLVKNEKITFGIVSILGGTVISCIGLLDKTFPVEEKCDHESIGIFMGCPIDESATKEKEFKGNILLTLGLGLVGTGIFTLFWAQ